MKFLLKNSDKSVLITIVMLNHSGTTHPELGLRVCQLGPGRRRLRLRASKGCGTFTSTPVITVGSTECPRDLLRGARPICLHNTKMPFLPSLIISQVTMEFSRRDVTCDDITLMTIEMCCVLSCTCFILVLIC
jgi:hypothetical protein